MKFPVRALVCSLFSVAVVLSAKDYQADFPAEAAAWQQNRNDDKLLVSVSGRSLILENTAPEHDAYTTLDQAPPEGPVEITTRFRLLGPSANRRVSLIWQAGPKIYSYFEVEDSGLYSLFDWTPAAWVSHRIRDTTTQAKPGEFNELTVRWINGRAFYTLNGATIDYHDTPGPRPPGIGFRFPAGARLEVESLTARTIPSAGAELTALAQKLTAEAAAHQKAADVVPNFSAPLPFPYVEEFENNNAGWPQKREQLELGFRDGAYEFENLSAEPNGLAWLTKNLPQPLTGDFEVSLTVSHLDGAGEPTAGIAFDVDDNWSRRAMTLTPKGYYYYSHDGKAWRDEYADGDTTLIKTGAGAANTIGFRVFGDRGYCLVNGTAVQMFTYPGSQGMRVALIGGSGTAVRFERMEVKPLTLTAAARAAELSRLEEQARTARIAAGPKRDEWVETFDNNQREWPATETAQLTSTLAGGELRYHHKDPGKGTHYYTKQVPLNQVADYDLSLRARFIGGNVQEMVALVWGNASDGSEHNRFCFFGNGTWYVYRRKGEDRQDLVKWTKTSALKPHGELNELTLRKVDDTYFFLINGQVLGDRPAYKVAGNGLGFEVGAGVQAGIDQLKVSYPNRTKAESVKEKELLFKTLAANSAKKGLGTASTAELKRAAEADKAAVAAMLRRENEEVDKLAAKYTNQSFARLVSERGLRSYAKRDNNIFYFTRQVIGGKQYYLRVICVHPDGNRRTDNDLNIIGIFLWEGPI